MSKAEYSRGARTHLIKVILTLCPITAAYARPILWYPFERSSSTQTDIGTAPQVNGSFAGSAAILQGTSPSSYSCASLNLTAAGNNYVTSTTDAQKIDALPELTVTLWVNLRAAPADGDCLISDMPSGFPPAGQGGWELRIVSDPGAPISIGLFDLSFEIMKASGGSNVYHTSYSSITGADNQWMFFAATYDSSKVQRFYKGKTNAAVAQFGFNTQFDADDNLRDNNAPLRIGGAGSEPTLDRTPPAWIDDVRIYNTALTTAQLEAIRLENISNIYANVVPSLSWIGDLPGQGCYNVAGGMSQDGSVITGVSLGPNVFEAYRLMNGTYTPLGQLPSSSAYSEGHAVSADGSTVVGISWTDDTHNQGFRWVNGTMTPLPDLPGGEIASWPYAITADGSRAVGYSVDRTGNQTLACAWDNGVLQTITLPENQQSIAYDISPDGGTIVGTRLKASGDYEAFRLDNGQVTFLPDIDGSGVGGRAVKLSADKKVVVGQGLSALGTEAALWRNGRVITIGDLPGSFVYGQALAVTRHGALVVGDGRSTGNVTEATIWDRYHGLRRLADALPMDYGLDVTYWNLQSAIGITPDGSMILGYGNAPSGVVASWIVRLPALPAMADFDHDNDVDQDDVSWFANCATRSGVPYNPAALPPGCLATPDLLGLIPPDIDWDGDVDMNDFAEVQRAATAVQACRHLRIVEAKALCHELLAAFLIAIGLFSRKFEARKAGSGKSKLEE